MNNIRKTEKNGDSKLNPSWVMRFFWWCAGVDKELLMHCRPEWSKYFSMGTTIFFTGAFAAISGGYALSMLFENPVLYISFGLFWGCFIFFLDRTIVTTIKFSKNESILSKIWRTSPRLILALFIGVVISTPLELKIFESNIRDGLRESIITNLKNEMASIDEDLKKIKENQASNNVISNGFSDQIKDREKSIDELKKEIELAYQKYLDEFNGTKGTGKKGIGPESRRLLREYEMLKRKNELLINNLYAEITDLNKDEKAHRTEQLEQIVNKSKDLLAQENEKTAQRDSLANEIYNVENGKQDSKLELTKKITTLWEISSLEKTDENGNVLSGNNILFWVHLFVMIFFIMIEMCPALVKIMIKYGMYDELVDAEVQKLSDFAEKIKQISKEDLKTDLEINTKRNDNRKSVEIPANRQTLENFFKVQRELLASAVKKWSDEEYRNIVNNPHAYLTDNMKETKDLATKKKDNEQESGEGWFMRNFD